LKEIDEFEGKLASEKERSSDKFAISQSVSHQCQSFGVRAAEWGGGDSGCGGRWQW